MAAVGPGAPGLSPSLSPGGRAEILRPILSLNSLSFAHGSPLPPYPLA